MPQFIERRRGDRAINFADLRRQVRRQGNRPVERECRHLEQRRSLRRPARAQIRLACGDTTIDALPVDLNSEGTSVIVPAIPNLLAVHSVKVDFPGRFALDFSAKVIYAEKLEGQDGYRVGLQFQPLSKWDQVLLAALVSDTFPAISPVPPVENVTTDEITAKFDKAREAFAAWKNDPLEQRVEAVWSLWNELLKNKEEMIRILHEETGKPAAEIEMMEIGAINLILKYFARNASRILKERRLPVPWIFGNKRAILRHMPRGIIGLITPWNLPLMIPLGDSIPALIAGNAVILKPSEWASRTALFLETAFASSGLFPDGLFQVLVGDGQVGEEVVNRAEIILFTGSTRTGRKVALKAAEGLKPAILEMAGKHPMIVLKDAPLKRTVKAAVWGGLANCGQLCVGVERIFVEKEVYEPFVDLIRKEVAGLRQDLSAGEGADLGRLIFPKQLEVFWRHLEDAREKGAEVLGGEILDARRLLIQPAVVANARPHMLVMREETFGPILPIMPVSSAEEAIELANLSPMGLSASIWTRDLSRAEALTRHVEAGLIGINDLLSHYVISSLPFGGFKESGLGHRHGEEGLRQFCRTQSVVVHRWPAQFPDLWWFPYSRFKTRLASFLSRLA